MNKRQAARTVATHMRVFIREQIRQREQNPNHVVPKAGKDLAEETAQDLYSRGIIDTIPHWTTIRDQYRETSA